MVYGEVKYSIRKGQVRIFYLYDELPKINRFQPFSYIELGCGRDKSCKISFLSAEGFQFSGYPTFTRFYVEATLYA
jgi:hypothetical protein